MDPFGVLLAIVALAVYPGGLLLACLAGMTFRLSGMPRATGLDVRGLAAICAAGLAASMATLPGSPAASLPPPGGATPNLVAAMLLLFVAGSLIAPVPWSPRRGIAVAFGGASLLLLGFAAASFSIATLSGASGLAATAARIVVAIGILVALPVIVQPHRPGGSAPARATLIAATVEVVLAILIPAGLHAPSTVLWVLGLIAAAAVYALLVRFGSAFAQREHITLVALAAACASAGSLAAIVASHAL